MGKHNYFDELIWLDDLIYHLKKGPIICRVEDLKAQYHRGESLSQIANLLSNKANGDVYYNNVEGDKVRLQVRLSK